MSAHRRGQWATLDDETLCAYSDRIDALYSS
jgi:hypothetical protein